jgi:protease YdgD
MHSWLRLILAMLIVCTLTTKGIAEEKLGIIGFDDRTDYWYADFDEYPGKALGQLKVHYPEKGQVGLCSATLIAPSAILTAAHCLYIPGSGASMPKADNIEFWWRYNGGVQQENHKFKAKAFFLRDEWRQGLNPSYDYAIIILKDRLMESGAALESVENIPAVLNASGKDDPAVRIAGYPGSKGGKVYVDVSTRYIVDPRRGLMLHDADIEKGQSGGPILFEKKVIGVHSFMAGKGNVSVALNNQMLQQIRQWVAEGGS